VNDPIVVLFPDLRIAGYRITSPADDDYNCIAWAASRKDRWWWPHPDAYWPPGAPTAQTLAAFESAYSTLGYIRCSTPAFEVHYEKVAIFARPDATPTHAARQLDSGKWTSKLGEDVDIEHAAPEAVGGTIYGGVAFYMQRPRPAWRRFLIWIRAEATLVLARMK